MSTENAVGWTFYGLVEDGLRDENGYRYINPGAYGFSPGEQVQGQLLLSGAALTAYLAALDGAGVGSVTLDASNGVDFYLPVPRVDGLDEADFTPWAAPVLTLHSQGLALPLADAQAFLFSQDDPDGPNFWMSQADAGGFFFQDDDDVQMHLHGAWVPMDVTPQQLIGGDGSDTLQGGNELALLFGRGGDDSLSLRGPGYAWGGFGEDVLRGGNGNDWLYGGFDDDVLSGGAGDDQLHGEGGSDQISGGTGNDIIHGDSIWKGSGHDRLSGNAGDDQLYGGWGDDLLRGGEGADLLDGGLGFDTADYSQASSGVGVNLNPLSSLVNWGEAAGDTLLSIENVTGSAFADQLSGGDGSNRLVGLAGNDYLNGGKGSDKLYGGAGDDLLDGGEGSGLDGRDYLTGGEGRDTFQFTLREWVTVPIGEDDYYSYAEPRSIGLDSVLDFNPLEDVLSFRGTGNAFSQMSISDYVSSSGQSGTRIDVGGDNTVYVLGVVADQLNDSNLQLINV